MIDCFLGVTLGRVTYTSSLATNNVEARDPEYALPSLSVEEDDRRLLRYMFSVIDLLREAGPKIIIMLLVYSAVKVNNYCI